MKTINTLIPDIYKMLEEGVEVSEEKLLEIGKSFAETLKGALTPREGGDGYLRPSNMGDSCERSLYYKVNASEAGEKFDGKTLLKFMIGHVTEEVVMSLAELAGHEVTGRQDKMEVNGVEGSRDGVIDGMLVDAKTASPYSFQRFKSGLTPETDAFGYIKQLGFYLEASQDDPKVRLKDRAAFFVIDKVSGELALDIHKKSSVSYVKEVDAKREMLSRPTPPARGFDPEPDGKSGNEKLPVKCSYCNFKFTCHPGVRTYLYSNGPRFLTKVVKEPNVTEIF